MNDNKKIAINSTIVFIRLVVTSLIGILLSRIVLDALGASDYGLYGVVGGIVTTLNVFNTAMLSTTYRFIASEMGKGSGGNLKKVFNTSFLIHAGFALFIILLGITVGEWYINNYLNVPKGKLSDARFVFHFSLITTALATILVPYQGLITAYEKFNVLAIRDILTRILLFLAIYFFLKVDANRLRLYALIQFGYNLVYNGSFYIYCKHKFKEESRFSFYKDIKLIKDMFSFAFWTLFGAVAFMARTQGIALLLNFFFGTLVNAAYAIATQVNGFIESFARSLNSAAVPQITKNFSGGNQTRSMTLTSYISKYTFILMSLIAFPVLIELDFLLGIWLKEVPEGASIFCKLLLLGGMLGTLGEGIPALVNATGSIKVYQVVYHTFNLLGLPVAWILLKIGYNQYTIMVVYCVVFFLSTFLRLFLLKTIYKFEIKPIVQVSYVRVLYVSLPLIFFYIAYDSSGFSIFRHFLGMTVSIFYLLIDVLLLGVDKKERNLIKSFVKSKMRK